MAFSSKFLVASIAVMALVVACADACTSSNNAGLFTDDVPFGCVEPFDCFLDFCDCVDGPLSTTCTPFNTSTSAATIEECAARRVTCTLNVALKARSVYNSSCQAWGDKLAAEYATYYADRSNTNLTDACMADMCSVVTAGASSLAGSVNYTYVCSLVNFSFPVPVPHGEVGGCAPAVRGYFQNELPLESCSGIAACYGTYCTCLGGTYNASAFKCTMPTTQPSSATSVSCAAATYGCFTAAALDVYVPGASPLSLDPCVAWSVSIAEDYQTYYNAAAGAAKQSTRLWQVCNASACQEIYRFNTSSPFSSACTFTAVAGRVPTFQAFDPCPYTCPDDTCAISLVGCACTSNAVVSNVQGEFLAPISSSMTFDVTKALQVTASASYRVSSGNCTSFDFSTALKFSWRLANASGTWVRTANGSTFTLAASTLTVGTTYTLNLTATGLKSTHVSMETWTFTVVAPTPKVSITASGATMRVPNTRAVAIKATVTDVSLGTYNWSCVNSSGTCPVLTNATAAVLYIASGEAAGTYLITYTYRGIYTSTLNLTIIAGEIPYVRILVPSTGALNNNPLAFLNSQSILLGSQVTFSSAVIFEWTINTDTTVRSNKSTLNLKASDLLSSTLTQIDAGTPNENTINLKVTSNTSSTVFGEASIVVVVVESLSMTVSIAKQGGGASAAGLTDKLVFTPVTTGLTTSNTPFGASIAYSIVYYDNVSNRNTAVGLATSASGSTRVGTAPLFTDSGSSKAIIFSVILRLNGLTAATANNTFTVTKPDLAAAAAKELASLASITDPAAAVTAAGNLRALMKLSTNATEVKTMANAALKLMNDTLRSGTPLSADQQVAAFSTIGTALSTQDASTKAKLSREMQSVMATTLSSSSFDSDNTDAVLGVIEAMDAQVAGETSVLLAFALSNDPKQPIGESKTVTIGGFAVTAVRQLGGALAGLEVSGSSGAGMSLPSSFSFGGGDDDIVGIASTVLTTSPYDGASPTGSVVTFDLTSNGAAVSVSGLSEPLKITLASGTGRCAFYDTTTSSWSTVGLSTVVTGTTIQCYSTHLTAFGSFASSAATVAISAVVVVLAALVQLVLA